MNNFRLSVDQYAEFLTLVSNCMWRCSWEPDSSSERIIVSGLAICLPPNARLGTFLQTSCPSEYRLQGSVSRDIFHGVVPCTEV